MPNPGLPPNELEKDREAFHKALKEGCTPPFIAPKKGEMSAINRVRQLRGLKSRGAVDGRLKALKDAGMEPDWSFYHPPEIVEVPAPRRPRVRVRVGEGHRPEGPEYRVLAIGDLHDHPHITDKSRFKWIGRYAAEHQIPYIRQIGDWGTFDSCSQFDNYGTVSGRMKPSFDQDITSLEESIAAMVRQFPEGYNPNRKVTMGNHENRVYQWEDAHPEVEGMFGIRVEQAFARGGFNYCQYGEWDFLGSVGFTHIPMTIMGKPYGGKNPENMIANDAMFSIVFGHTHKKHFLPRPKIGPQRRITIVNLGCALPHGHVEPYAALSMTGWSYGIYDLTIQCGDIQAERWVSMIELEKVFG